MSSIALAQYISDVEVVIKCKTLPRWFAGTSAQDGGCCEQKVSRYCRYVYQYGKIGPSEDPDRKEGNEEVVVWVPESIQNYERGPVKKTAHGQGM